MELDTLLEEMHLHGASDLHLVAGQAAGLRLGGRLARMEETTLSALELEEMLVPRLSAREAELLIGQREDVNKAYRFNGRSFLLHLFHERGQLAANIRALPARIPSLEEIYENSTTGALLGSLVTHRSGLIVVTGHTGSGKMTTLASIIERINESEERRIVTLEDPIQYEFESKKSLITQRNVGEDVCDYRQAARSVFRQDADVVLFGEMLDMEALALAMALADSGRLVLLPTHCERAAQAVYRLIEVFPEPRGHIRRLLARNLLAVIAQALLPRSNRPGRVAVNEILLPTQHIRNAIAEGLPELEAAIAAGRSDGMQSMDDGALELFRSGAISEETARQHLDDAGRLEILQPGLSSPPNSLN